MKRDNKWGRTNVIYVQSSKQNYIRTDIIRTYKSVKTLIIIGAHNMWKWVKQKNLHISIPAFICTYHHTTIQHRITATMEIFSPFQVSSRSLLLWKVAWLELVTDSSEQNISHQIPTQAMKHTRRANTSTTLHYKSEVLHHDKNSTFMVPFVSSELKSLRSSHTYNHLHLYYYRSPAGSNSQQSFLDQRQQPPSK